MTRALFIVRIRLQCFVFVLCEIQEVQRRHKLLCVRRRVNREEERRGRTTFGLLNCVTEVF